MNIKQITPVETVLPLEELSALSKDAYHLQPFDERTVSFLDALSKTMLADATINRIPEMAALGFWLRKGNIEQIRKDNSHLFGSSIVLAPIGKVLHICPANVDTMFFYSLTVSLLMGNRNILRISGRMDVAHILRLFTHINTLLSGEKFRVLSSYINVITYGHEREISEFLSVNVNARMIWGGDNTIRTFRQFTTAPRTKDIVFADRISALCIKCSGYLSLDTKGKENFANLFLNDAYTFDQKGCSSPQSIYFLGTADGYQNCLQQMQADLSVYVEERYNTEIEALASLKLNQLVDDSISGIAARKYGNNYCTFVALKEQQPAEMHHSCGGGYFYANRISSVEDMQGIVNTKLQTISYFGLDEAELDRLKQMANNEGIDRIVPLGMALNFNYIWDGYNLLDELSRKVFYK
jgi:hypothetical protein